MGSSIRLGQKYIPGTTMKIKKWLTVASNKSARLTAGKPSLDWDEVSIMLEVDIPDAMFKRPRLEAKITVPDEAAAAETINASVSDNVQEAIEQATGLTFSISVAKPDNA